MSIINCSADCIYEDNGKCTLDHVEIISCTSSDECAFYKVREKKKPQPKEDNSYEQTKLPH